jgi:hypothetical protein
MTPCKVFGPNRTKMFHVKHFGTIARPDRSFLTTGGRAQLPKVDPRLAERALILRIQCGIEDERGVGPASRLVVKVSPCGRSAMSSLSFDTSMPTTIASISNLPCTTGLIVRPKRLFGLDGPSASSGGGRDTKLRKGLGCPGMIRSHVRHRRLDCSACRRQVTRTRSLFRDVRDDLRA